MKDGDDLKYYRMDMIRGHLPKQKTTFEKLEFNLLSKIAKLVLMLPHSNAGEKTETRKNLRFNTLGSILTAKMSSKNSIHFRTTEDVLKAVKRATWDYMKEHVVNKSTSKSAWSFLSLYPMKTYKMRGFKFSGGIERDCGLKWVITYVLMVQKNVFFASKDLH